MDWFSAPSDCDVLLVIFIMTFDQSHMHYRINWDISADMITDDPLLPHLMNQYTKNRIHTFRADSCTFFLIFITFHLTVFEQFSWSIIPVSQDDHLIILENILQNFKMFEQQRYLRDVLMYYLKIQDHFIQNIIGNRNPGLRRTVSDLFRIPAVWSPSEKVT